MERKKLSLAMSMFFTRGINLKFSLLFIFVLLHSPLEAKEVVRIAVATNLSSVFPAIERDFSKKYPGVELQPIFASSGKLTHQIIQGAPYDLFLSADMTYPQRLVERGFAVGKPRVYALGQLVLLVKKESKGKGLSFLLEPTVQKIALANPRFAPYGRAAQEVLRHLKWEKQLHKKLVIAESLSQAVHLTLFATDIGFVAKSIFFSPQFQNREGDWGWVEIPKAMYTPLRQGSVLLRRGQQKEFAQKFYESLFSKVTQELFQSYGYLPYE